jgi:ABC-2 type transport system ATP-binding protein
MRVLSCFMPASEGTARICGRDVFSESIEVRRRIGYMPENNPLHHDMRVREYLKFRGRIKGLGWKRSRQRVNTVIEQCGLNDVAHRIIGQLSKGFRQRVGLADALVNEPELLILDEPTIGLDPEQIRSVRQLIKNLAPAHTVLISTHILPEAEMICDRIIILGNGKVLAADTSHNLQARIHGKGQVIAEIAAPMKALQECWAQMPEVAQYDVSPGQGDYFRCALIPQNGMDLRPVIFSMVRERGWSLRELTRNAATLEDIYIQITRPPEEEEN